MSKEDRLIQLLRNVCYDLISMGEIHDWLIRHGQELMDLGVTDRLPNNTPYVFPSDAECLEIIEMVHHSHTPEFQVAKIREILNRFKLVQE